LSTEFPGHRPDDPSQVPVDFPVNWPEDPLGTMRGDLMDDIVSSEPGLDALVGLLTSDATPEELTSEQTALTMFRAHRPPVIPLPELGTDAPAAPGVVAPGAPEAPGGFGPPAFDPSAYAPPVLDPPAYTRPVFGPSAYTSPAYGPPGAGEPGYGPPGAGEPGYGLPGAGEPGYGPPMPGEPAYGPPAVGTPGVRESAYGPPMPEAAFGLPPVGAPGVGAVPGDTREIGPPGFGAPGFEAPDPWASAPSAPAGHGPVAPVLPGPGAPVLPGPGAPGSRRPGRGRRVGLMAAAVTLAAAAGFAVAAYTESLPAPLQHAAFQAFGFVGVPSGHHSAPGASASHSPGHGRHGSHQPGPSQPGASASPQPSASGAAPAGLRLSITSSSARIPAGEDDTFTGQLSTHAGPVANVGLTLLERVAGQPNWVLAGNATTGSNGSGAVTATDLTRNAAFRLRSADGALSRPVVVIVAPPVTASLSAGSGAHTATVGVSSPLANPGDRVMLQIKSGATWMSVQTVRLNNGDQASFLIRIRPKLRMYRVVLLPTALHGISVSNTVTSAPR
jgi:hypothetical protein